MEHNDKAWINQQKPGYTNDQLYRFIEGVGKRLDHLDNQNTEQLEAARQAALLDINGVAA